MQNMMKMALGGMMMLALTACGETYSPGGSSVGVRDSALQGDMGPVRDLDDSARATVWASDWDTSFNVNVDRRNDSAMAIVSVGASAAQLEALAGHRLVQSGYGIEVQNEDGTVDEELTEENGDIYIDVIGCAGPGPGQWDFDEPAEDVVIAIDENPENTDEVILSFVGTFDRDGGFFDEREDQVTTGTVTFLPDEIGGVRSDSFESGPRGAFR